MHLAQMLIQKKALYIFNDLNSNSASKSVDETNEFESSSISKKAKICIIWHSKGETAITDNFKDELKCIVEDGEYSSNQVFNVDKTGLF